MSTNNDPIMNKSGLPDEFLDTSDIDNLDDQLVGRVTSGSLIDRMQAQQSKMSERLSSSKTEFNRHKFLYTLLVVSGFLTALTGLYLGLAPEIMTNTDGSTYIHFHTDFGHLLMAAVYMIVFPLVTEVAFKQALNRFDKRESNNTGQAISSMGAMVVGLLAMLGTGVAGFYVIAASLGFLSEFKDIPPSVQDYLVWTVPVLICFYIAMYVWYITVSRVKRSEYFLAEQDKTDELDDQLRTSEITRYGKRKVKMAAINMYAALVMKGVISQSEADMALDERLSLADLERRLKRDLTGENKIGHVPAGFDPDQAKAPEPQAPPVLSQSDPGWTHYPVARSVRGSIIPWQCAKCGKWYVSDVCPDDGSPSPELEVMQNAKKNGASKNP